MTICILFHNWSIWQEYVLESTVVLTGRLYPEDVRGRTFKTNDNMQKRHCKRCGKVQRVEVGEF